MSGCGLPISACQEMGTPIVAHSGPDKLGMGYAEPRAFAGMLAAFPDLKVVIAHMGGGTWGQARELAEAYSNAYFDCCEIIEWVGGATNAPGEEEFAQLIRDIGASRVLMGSDFPWYDLDRTIEQVMALPLLSNEEKEGMLGAYALSRPWDSDSCRDPPRSVLGTLRLRSGRTEPPPLDFGQGFTSGRFGRSWSSADWPSPRRSCLRSWGSPDHPCGEPSGSP